MATSGSIKRLDVNSTVAVSSLPILGTESGLAVVQLYIFGGSATAKTTEENENEIVDVRPAVAPVYAAAAAIKCTLPNALPLVIRSFNKNLTNDLCIDKTNATAQLIQGTIQKFAKADGAVIVYDLGSSFGTAASLRHAVDVANEERVSKTIVAFSTSGKFVMTDAKGKSMVQAYVFTKEEMTQFKTAAVKCDATSVSVVVRSASHVYVDGTKQKLCVMPDYTMKQVHRIIQDSTKEVGYDMFYSTAADNYNTNSTTTSVFAAMIEMNKLQTDSNTKLGLFRIFGDRNASLAKTVDSMCSAKSPKTLQVFIQNPDASLKLSDVTGLVSCSTTGAITVSAALYSGNGWVESKNKAAICVRESMSVFDFYALMKRALDSTHFKLYAVTGQSSANDQETAQRFFAQGGSAPYSFKLIEDSTTKTAATKSLTIANFVNGRRQLRMLALDTTPMGVVDCTKEPSAGKLN